MKPIPKKKHFSQQTSCFSSQQCAPCPRGEAKPELGNQMCSQCSTGRVAQQTASTACKFCPAGSDGM